METISTPAPINAQWRRPSAVIINTVSRDTATAAVTAASGMLDTKTGLPSGRSTTKRPASLTPKIISSATVASTRADFNTPVPSTSHTAVTPVPARSSRTLTVGGTPSGTTSRDDTSTTTPGIISTPVECIDSAQRLPKLLEETTPPLILNPWVEPFPPLIVKLVSIAKKSNSATKIPTPYSPPPLTNYPPRAV
ncbi:MAG: hypothetical protein J1E63_02320, partial [Muribaculaceae bacterium]|nr:hypothetical protein [Muribaculaceae bacterium]